MSNIVLHQWEVSPFCGKVRRMLRFKGLQWRTEDYNGLRAPEAAHLSSTGKLPVLEWNGERIADSTVIARFLDARVPDAPALFPRDPALAAQVALWEDWADESLYWFEVYLRIMYPEVLSKVVSLLCNGRPAWERRIVWTVFPRQVRARLEAQGLGLLPRETVEPMFVRHLDMIETCLAGRDWLVGDVQTVADIAVAAQLDEVLRTSTLAGAIRERRNLAAWIERQQQPAVAAA